MLSLLKTNQNRIDLVNRFGLRKYNPFRQVFTDNIIYTVSINTNWLVGKRLFLTPNEKRMLNYEKHL